ncbi:MAG: type I restriction endonuclease subunit R [Verrucomicrobia bacterium]|nr:type I restriction endonuclease subunit R [Verrucomicrobiota bacterium]
MGVSLVENDVELASLDWLQGLGYTTTFGPHIAPGEPGAERASFADTILAPRLRVALRKLNPGLPAGALDEAFQKVTVPQHPSLIANNRAFHRMLVDGIAVECPRQDDSVGTEIIRLVDFDDPAANDWLAVNQFTVIEGQQNRRPDIVIFINGLPLGVIELKNAADENADIWAAFNQLQTYKQQIPSLFVQNAVLIVSDGLEARIGTISAERERFMPWRTITGEVLAPVNLPQLEVLLRGVFDKARFLDLVRHFIVFEDEPFQAGTSSVVKKMAGYHQFHAVRVAVEETLRACGTARGETQHDRSGGYFVGRMPGGTVGDKRAGVVWHTQGSGKSLTMAFYAGRLVVEPAMENPTVVVLTDRNDLDDQLFGTFARCHELLRQKPVQAESRDHLKKLLQVASGGVIFTTVQKFFPEEKRGKYPLLSDRLNIVVIADEAHRSQYDFIDGFARHMRDALPNASFIGFTGTPIEKADANTRGVFGDYISIYDIQRAVEDKATVPIYYESRLAKLELKPDEKPNIDPDFEEATEGEEADHKEKLKTKWAALEAIVGAENRIGLIAADLVKHWDARWEVMEGKAMIVCMSRRICVEVYEAIRKVRPKWHHQDDDKGLMKIVMTGSASDPLEWQDHIRNKSRRESLAKRFKQPDDPFKIVIVRDMWLTGFDAPCLHTMYVDKPMRSHGLMQAIARVNRVFRDKPGGLVVDYLGLAHELKQALATYTESGGTGKTAIAQEEAVAVMLEKHEICCDFFHGFDRSKWTAGKPTERLAVLPAAQEFILAQGARDRQPDEYTQKFLRAVTELSQAFAIAVPHTKAMEIRDDVGFFQAVRAALGKAGGEKRQTAEDLDFAIRQIISRVVSSDEVVDIFAAAGLKKPDISILSDEFLAEVRNLPQKNLAVEVLRKLLSNEIRVRSKKFLIQSKSFAEMLEASIRKYQNRAIEAAAVIQELIELARQMREAGQRGETLRLTEDELAFYDALEVNDSAVKVLGEPTLKSIAHELVATIRNSVTIDWTEREAVRAKIRVAVKRILRKHGYPPDKQEKATQTVLQQAELLCADWAG